jgi:hypothetical protein
MVNGAMSRKVEITLNSAVSLVQTLQPLLFILCYKSGGRKIKAPSGTHRSNLRPLAYNVPGIATVPEYVALNCPPRKNYERTK